MRVVDPIGGPPNLEEYFYNYDTYFHDLTHYSYHLRRLIAGYSRGDDRDELGATFALVVEKLAVTRNDSAAQYGADAPVLEHKGKYAEAFRDALVLLSFGLCLRAPTPQIEIVLENCERGDPLLETFAGAVGADLSRPHTTPAFYPYFDGLYDALTASEPERERCVRDYLSHWYQEKMEGFAFKDVHLEQDNSGYVGYWCFEAAGTVAALQIDDGSFRTHAHYPAALVEFYRR